MNDLTQEVTRLQTELERLSVALFLARSELAFLSDYGLEGDSAEMNYTNMRTIAKQAVKQIDKTIQ